MRCKTSCCEEPLTLAIATLLSLMDDASSGPPSLIFESMVDATGTLKRPARTAGTRGSREKLDKHRGRRGCARSVVSLLQCILILHYKVVSQSW